MGTDVSARWVSDSGENIKPFCFVIQLLARPSENLSAVVGTMN